MLDTLPDALLGSILSHVTSPVDLGRLRCVGRSLREYLASPEHWDQLLRSFEHSLQKHTTSWQALGEDIALYCNWRYDWLGLRSSRVSSSFLAISKCHDRQPDKQLLTQPPEWLEISDVDPTQLASSSAVHNRSRKPPDASLSADDSSQSDGDDDAWDSDVERAISSIPAINSTSVLSGVVRQALAGLMNIRPGATSSTGNQTVTGKAASQTAARASNCHYHACPAALQREGMIAEDDMQMKQQPTWSPTGKMLAYSTIVRIPGSRSNYVVVADPNAQPLVCVDLGPTQPAPFFLAWSSCGNYLATLGGAAMGAREGVTLLVLDVAAALVPGGSGPRLAQVGITSPVFMHWSPTAPKLLLHIRARGYATWDAEQGSFMAMPPHPTIPGMWSMPQGYADGEDQWSMFHVDEGYHNWQCPIWFRDFTGKEWFLVTLLGHPVPPEAASHPTAGTTEQHTQATHEYDRLSHDAASAQQSTCIGSSPILRDSVSDMPSALTVPAPGVWPLRRLARCHVPSDPTAVLEDDDSDMDSPLVIEGEALSRCWSHQENPGSPMYQTFKRHCIFALHPDRPDDPTAARLLFTLRGVGMSAAVNSLGTHLAVISEGKLMVRDLRDTAGQLVILYPLRNAECVVLDPATQQLTCSDDAAGGSVASSQEGKSLKEVLETEKAKVEAFDKISPEEDRTACPGMFSIRFGAAGSTSHSSRSRHGNSMQTDDDKNVKTGSASGSQREAGSHDQASACRTKYEQLKALNDLFGSDSVSRAMCMWWSPDGTKLLLQATTLGRYGMQLLVFDFAPTAIVHQARPVDAFYSSEAQGEAAAESAADTGFCTAAAPQRGGMPLCGVPSRVISCGSFAASHTLMRNYFPFSDQYKINLTLWSPDSDAFCFAGWATGTRVSAHPLEPKVYVQKLPSSHVCTIGHHPGCAFGNSQSKATATSSPGDATGGAGHTCNRTAAMSAQIGEWEVGDRAISGDAMIAEGDSAMPEATSTHAIDSAVDSVLVQLTNPHALLGEEERCINRRVFEFVKASTPVLQSENANFAAWSPRY